MRRIQRSISECIAPAKFVAVERSEPVSTAVAKMLETNVSCALVVENQRLVGIFTGRDFVHRVSAKRRDPSKTPIEQAMTADPDTLRPQDCISYAINLMATQGFRHVPIVDRDRKPVSVLDTRLVMTHLIKVFAELEQFHGQDLMQDGYEGDAWVDLGGGD